MSQGIVRADLRSFYAIGFQNSKTNGLWLGKQGIDPSLLLKWFIDTCMDKNISLVAITTEDSRVNKYSPEDRFGFLLKSPMPHPHGLEYVFNQIDDNLLHVRRKIDENALLMLNSETIHSPEGYYSWGGLKLHVLGQNRLEKFPRIEDNISYCEDEGLLTFLGGITKEMLNGAVVDIVAPRVFGIITHDANNTYGNLVKCLPLFGKALLSKRRSSNKAAKEVASYHDKPGIAVSSAHWPDEIGRAHTAFPSTYIDLNNPHSTQRLLNRISNALLSDSCTYSEGFHNPIRVAYTGYLLKKFGGKEDRFAGDPRSSYNSNGVVK